MRPRRLLLLALLGALGSFSVRAQPVYYMTATNQPGFNLITCPLVVSPVNTIGTVLNNASGAFTGNIVYFYNNAPVCIAKTMPCQLEQEKAKPRTPTAGHSAVRTS